MPVYKNTAQNQKLGRVGKEYTMKGNPGNKTAQGGVNVPLKGAASKQGLVANQKLPPEYHYFYKDTPNNRKLGRVGEKKIKGGGKFAPKPGIDKDLFMGALNQMTMLAKSKGKADNTDLKVELNKIKGRPSFKLFQLILLSNQALSKTILKAEENVREEEVYVNGEKIINSKVKQPGKTYEELSPFQKKIFDQIVNTQVKKSRLEFQKKTWDTVVKGAKMKRWSYDELVKLGKEIYSNYRTGTL